MRSLVAAALLVLAVEARAAPCAAFTDVDSTSPFCAGVAWMKNRGITSGCTATLYCPNDPVSRLAMAAFLSRLDRVLPLTLVDANGVAVGPVVAQRGHHLTVAYRTPLQPDRVHLLWVVMDWVPMDGESRLGYYWNQFAMNFVTADCTGVGYLQFTRWPPEPDIHTHLHAGGLSFVVKGPGGEHWLYASVSSPLPYEITPGQLVVASWRNGLGSCVPLGSSTLDNHILPFSQVEDLSAKFAQPFILR